MRSAEEINGVLRQFIRKIEPANLKKGTNSSADIAAILLEVDAIVQLLDHFPEDSLQHESIHFVLRSFCNLGYVAALRQAEFNPIFRPLIEKCILVSLDLNERRRISYKARFGDSWGF